MNKIKAYVGCDEYNKVYHYEYFTIEEGTYEVGDFYDHEEIKEITKVKLDVNQPKHECWDYDYFRILTTCDKEYDLENDVFCEYFIAIHKQEEG